MDERPALDLPQAPRWSPETKRIVAICLLLGAFVLLWLLRGIFPIVAMAGLLAFLVGPIIRLLHTRLHLPRWLALLISYFIVVTLVLAFMLLVAGSVLASIQDIDPGATVEGVRVWVVNVLGESRSVRMFGARFDLSEIVAPIEGWLQGEGGLPLEAGQDTAFVVDARVLRYLQGGIFSSVATVPMMIATILTTTIVVTLIAMYLSLDSRRYYNGVMRLAPAGYEGDSLRLADDIKKVWTGYMYGQVINSIITAFMVWVVLMLVGLPGALLMAFIMLVLNMIPTIGPILAAVPGVLMALIYGSERLDMSNLTFALLVTVIYIVVVQLQANLIAPKVMGSAVSMRPAVIMLGLIAGLQIGGLLGSLLAVPVIATGRDITRYFYYRLIDRDPWPPDDSEGSEESEESYEPDEPAEPHPEAQAAAPSDSAEAQDG